MKINEIRKQTQSEKNKNENRTIEQKNESEKRIRKQSKPIRNKPFKNHMFPDALISHVHYFGSI